MRLIIEIEIEAEPAAALGLFLWLRTLIEVPEVEIVNVRIASHWFFRLRVSIKSFPLMEIVEIKAHIPIAVILRLLRHFWFHAHAFISFGLLHYLCCLDALLLIGQCCLQRRLNSSLHLLVFRLFFTSFATAFDRLSHGLGVLRIRVHYAELSWPPSLRLLVLEIRFEVFLVVLLVKQVVKRLIVDPQLELVAMLHDGNFIASDRNRVLEGAIALSAFEYLLSIVHDLLLAGQHRIEQLNLVLLVVQGKLPDELYLGR